MIAPAAGLPIWIMPAPQLMVEMKRSSWVSWGGLEGSLEGVGFSRAASSALIDRADEDRDDRDCPSLGFPTYLRLELLSSW